ncbi:hypothetical protein [Haloferax gibbonsii]|uniref:hypothetical protein n=1 Tax=Haloferax gibbonsii TaxID=35746 RepID=UPI000B31341D|nr:hypothetical protein [Haloferax gibbonsii]
MSFHEFVGIGLSIIAVGISLHTKYQQRQKDKLRELANKLKRVQDDLQCIEREVTNPRTHEDIELSLTDIPREMLACKHELGKDNISIFTEVTTGFRSDSNDVPDPDKLSNKIRSDEPYLVEVKIGDRSEMYLSERNFMIDDPFRYSSRALTELSDIEEEFGTTIDEFNDSLIPELKSRLESIIRRHSEHIIHNDEFTLQVSQYESTEEMGTAVFEQIYYYDGIEEDLEGLSEVYDEVEDLRTTILQTSYS